MQMTVKEFLKRAKKYAKAHNKTFRYDVGHGKGSHGRVYVDGKFTAIKGINKDIGKGLCHDMLKDLGIDKDAF